VDFQARIKDGAVSGGTPPPETGVKVCECCGGTGGGGGAGGGKGNKGGKQGGEEWDTMDINCIRL
jgi:hypothetical protein